MQERVRIERHWDGRVGRLIMSSPQNLNAMDLEMAQAFRSARENFEANPVQVVVISGEGRAFSAGGDLKMLRRKSEKDESINEEEMLWFYSSFLGLRDLGVPLVVALQGHVVGAGFCFAAACDLRVADESVRLACPFNRLGLHPGMGGSYFLPRALGPSKAQEMMLTGRRMKGHEALQCGFLAQLTPAGEVETAIEHQLRAMFAGGPRATRALIETERESCRVQLQAALHREAREQALCYASEEFLEGVDALLEKRPPSWEKS